MADLASAYLGGLQAKNQKNSQLFDSLFKMGFGASPGAKQGFDLKKKAEQAVLNTLSGQGTPEDEMFIKAFSAMEGPKTTFKPDESGRVTAMSEPPLFERLQSMKSGQSSEPSPNLAQGLMSIASPGSDLENMAFSGQSPQFMQSDSYYDTGPTTRQKAAEKRLDVQGNLAQKEGEDKIDVLTNAQKKVDDSFAEEYVKYNALGGYSDQLKQMEQLGLAIDNLEKSGGITGPLIGVLPKGARDRFLPQSSDTQEIVEEVVQRNLREILGAQFTEKEGERLISRAYNPNLDESINARRTKNLLEQMKRAAQAKSEAMDYFEQNGTLKGWSGALPTINDFDPDRSMGGDKPSSRFRDGQTATNPQTGEKLVYRNGKWQPL